MSLKGLRFTLEVDGLPETATAVVSFTLYQNLSTPFHSVSILPATSLTSPQRISLKSNATLTVWQGTVPQRYLHGIITGMQDRGKQ
jgi:type VI secretion system secreted protein VgrG